MTSIVPAITIVTANARGYGDYGLPTDNYTIASTEPQSFSCGAIRVSTDAELATAAAKGRVEMAIFTLTFAAAGSCTIAFSAGSTALPAIAATLSSGTTSVGVMPSGTITEYGGSLSNPNGITAGPDGNLWFPKQGNGKMGKIVP